MCFLRHARGFGCLDPNLPSEAAYPLLDTKTPKSRPAPPGAHRDAATGLARQRERGEHGRLDRVRHSRRNLIDGQATPCARASKRRVGAPPLTHLRGKAAIASPAETPLRS
jgi:hypothetical protein